MEIWLLRHAAAEDHSDSGRDADRTLTEDGHRRAREVGRGLAELEPGIDLILTSPYARARQTAEPVARALRLGDSLRETQALEPSSDPEEILEEVRSEKAEGVLLVGHEPHLGSLLGRLVAGGPGLEIPMRKASVARLSWPGSGTATLRAILPAKLLARLGASKDKDKD
jgi:phosphohistidine phosphatase